MKLRKRTLRFVADKNNDEGGAGGTRRSAHSLRRRATEVMNYRIVRKMLLIGVAIGTAVLLMFYAFALLYNRTGRFTVSIDNPNTASLITLFQEKPQDTDSAGNTVLTDDEGTGGKGVSITNISGKSLDDEKLDGDDLNGSHNGEDYIAYTFYCKNVGDAAVSMHYELTFNNVTNDIDEAMRVRLYVNGEKTDYAKKNRKTGGKEEHYCDETFLGDYAVCKGIVNDVQPNDHARFTIVIWLEGDDPDCDDSVKNGQMKLDMNIKAATPIA